MFEDPLTFSEDSNYSKIMESSLDGLVSCAYLEKPLYSFETHVETNLEILQRDFKFAMDSGTLLTNSILVYYILLSVKYL